MKKQIVKSVKFTQSPVPFGNGKKIGIYVDEHEKIWFHGPDVARMLEYSHSSDMYRMIDDENKGAHIVQGVNNGSNGKCVSISEAGFYQVALSSRTELGKKLFKFVCEELLPSIRKTGAYLSDNLTSEQVKRVVEDQIVEKCIQASRGRTVRIGGLIKALLDTRSVDSMRKDIFPYILQKLTESQVYRVKEVFFERATESIADWGNDKFIASGGKLDILDHMGLLYLLKETEEKKSTFLAASRSQTVRQLKNKNKSNTVKSSQSIDPNSDEIF